MATTWDGARDIKVFSLWLYEYVENTQGNHTDEQENMAEDIQKGQGGCRKRGTHEVITLAQLHFTYPDIK